LALRSKDLSKNVLKLLLEVSRKAYYEGRKHEVEEEDIVGIIHMQSFEDTKIYKDIMENWK